MIKCIICNKEFYPDDEKNFFCSEDCLDEAREVSCFDEEMYLEHKKNDR